METRRNPSRHAGASLIEVLVALLIVAFGLLGMAGLHAQLQVSEFESYQRTQALMLLGDMASRIATNRRNAPAYVTGIVYGGGADCPLAAGTTAERDLKEWCEALNGAGEKTGATLQGAMIGGRGCVENVGGDYLVTVAWQGRTPIAAAPASLSCGAGAYDLPAGSRCRDDLCRRTVTTVVRVANLL